MIDCHTQARLLQEDLREADKLSSEALAALEAGLQSAATGEVYYLGSFAQYADDE